MAYENLKSAIKQAIKNNNNQEITGDLLQSTLISMVNSLSSEWEYLGVATFDTIPTASLEKKSYYISIYDTRVFKNFPGISSMPNGLNIIYSDNGTQWNFQNLLTVKNTIDDDLSGDAVVSQKALYKKFLDINTLLYVDITTTTTTTTQVNVILDKVIHGKFLTDQGFEQINEYYSIDVYKVIKPEGQIFIKAKIGLSAYICVYNNSNRIIKTIQGRFDYQSGNGEYEDYSFSIPKDAAIIKIPHSTTIAADIKGEVVAGGAVEYHKSVKDFTLDLNKLILGVENRVSILENSGSSGSSSSSKLAGKKIGLLGDSIAAGSITSNINNSFIAVACKKLNSSYKNVSVGGWFCGDAENRSIYRQITNLDGNEDLIVIFAGTNDYGHSFNIGKPYNEDSNKQKTPYIDEINSTCGGLTKTITMLYSKYGGYIPIVICLPIQRKLNGKTSTGGSWGYNTIGKTMSDYADAIKKLAAFFGIPVADFSDLMNPNIDAENTLFFADGLHPNDLGHKLLGTALAEFLNSKTFYFKS